MFLIKYLQVYKLLKYMTQITKIQIIHNVYMYICIYLQIIIELLKKQKYLKDPL